MASKRPIGPAGPPKDDTKQNAATAAGGSVPTKKLAGAAVVGLAGYKKFVAPN